jgi:hypothetical protein
MVNAPKYSFVDGLALHEVESKVGLLLHDWDIRALTLQKD